MSIILYVAIISGIFSVLLFCVSLVLWRKSTALSLTQYSSLQMLILGSNPEVQTRTLYEVCLQILSSKNTQIQSRLLNEEEEERHRKKRLKQTNSSLHTASSKTPLSEEIIELNKLTASELSTKNQLAIYQKSPHSIAVTHEDSCLIQLQFLNENAPPEAMIIELKQSLPALNQTQAHHKLSSSDEIGAYTALLIMLEAEDLEAQKTSIKSNPTNLNHNIQSIVGAWTAAYYEKARNKHLPHIASEAELIVKASQSNKELQTHGHLFNILYNKKSDETHKLFTELDDCIEPIFFEFRQLPTIHNSSNYYDKHAHLLKTEQSDSLAVQPSIDPSNLSLTVRNKHVNEKTEFIDHFLSHLEMHLIDIQQQKTRDLRTRKRLKLIGILSLLFTLNGLYFLNSHLILSHIPQLEKVDQWSVESLEHTERALLQVTKSSHTVSPLWFGRSLIAERLLQFDQIFKLHLEQQILDQISNIAHYNRSKQELAPGPKISSILPIGSDKHQRILSIIMRSQARQKRFQKRLGVDTKNLAQYLAELAQAYTSIQILHHFIYQLNKSSDFLDALNVIKLLESQWSNPPNVEKQVCSDQKDFSCRISQQKKHMILSSYMQIFRLIPDTGLTHLIKWRWAMCLSREQNSISESAYRDSTTEYQARFKEVWHYSLPNLKTNLNSNSTRFEYGKLSLAALQNLKLLHDERMRLVNKLNIDACQQDLWSSDWQLKWQNRVIHHARALKTLLASNVPTLDHDLHKDSQDLFTWALSQLTSLQRQDLRLELYHSRWTQRLNHAFKASTNQPLFQSSNFIRRQIKSLIEVQTKLKDKGATNSKSGASHTQQPRLSQKQLTYLYSWQKHLENLSDWLEPKFIWLSYDKIDCKENVLRAHGESRWNILLGDRLNYYFTVQVNDQVFLIHPIKGDKIRIWWKPWSKVTIRVYEQDGEIDLVSTENNDHQIGLTKQEYWPYLPKETSHLIQGTADPFDLTSIQFKSAQFSKQAQKFFLNEDQSCWTHLIFSAKP